MTYRILALDGGGIRGAYTAQILKRLTDAEPKFLGELNLIAGTSTGGIIALGLAAGMTPDQLVGIYRDHGPEIFDRSLLGAVFNPASSMRAKYRNTGLKARLIEEFETRRGVTTLRDLKPRVLIASFDLSAKAVVDSGGKMEHVKTWKPKFFHNFPPTPLAKSDQDERVVDVALRTSAAPTFFPSHQGFIDGGVVANNPSMAAVAQALDCETGRQKIEDIRMLSIGTGINLQVIAGRELDWGWPRWIGPLLEGVLVDGVGLVVHYECMRLLGKGRYWRVNEPLGEEIRMDDCSRVPRLRELANQVDIAKALDLIRTP